MRNWILGGFLACFTTAGIAYVLAKNSSESHCGPCIEKPAEVESVRRLPQEVIGRPAESSDTCEHCKAKPDKSGVVDVVDLDRTFLMADGTKPPVSFEEPPLAKPRGEVTPVVFLTPVPAVEVLPMPREVEAGSETFNNQVRDFIGRFADPGKYLPEVAPMPREVK